MSRKVRINVGVIGLGIIGSRVAAGLRAAAFQVYVWNRSAKPAPNFLGSPAEVAESAEIIQIFVSDFPPLDFQTFPDWLYDLMYPPFHRATRRFLNEYLRAFERAGFMIEAVTPLRTVDSDYYERVRPKLRPAAQRVPESELCVIEVAVLAQRPG